jgi:hypothetical protein
MGKTAVHLLLASLKQTIPTTFSRLEWFPVAHAQFVVPAYGRFCRRHHSNVIYSHGRHK